MVRIQNNFNGFSLNDVHQNATLSESLEGDRSRVIGNRCKECSAQAGLPIKYQSERATEVRMDRASVFHVLFKSFRQFNNLIMHDELL